MPKIPNISHRLAVRAFQKAGFVITRESKHVVMRKGVRTLIIPRHDPINAYTLGTIVVRDAGLTIEEFMELL